jgi:photosystem II stability/assembly factor-like uncharacterized protein
VGFAEVTALAAAAVVAASPPGGLCAQEPASEAYRWSNVQIVGGGFVTGVVFHPTAPAVRYARTDIGGAYRWSDGEGRWEPVLDWVSFDDANLMGVESIALDPSDPERLYLALGTYTAPDVPDGAIVRSDDRGATFERTDVPFKMGGNENGRGNGERLAVDPNDGRVLYLGTRHDGLWRSTDRGVGWERVTSFPEVAEPVPAGEPRWRVPGSGIVAVVFDPESGSPGEPSPTILVAVSLLGRDHLFRSTDAGTTWRPVPGQPTRYRPNHAMLASDGTLYLSYGTDAGPRPMRDGGVWKLDTDTDTWTDITPDRPDPDGGRAFGYAAVAVDATDPRTVLATTFGRPPGEELFRSTDGGESWRAVFGGGGGGTFDFSLAPYVASTPIHWMFDVEIDPGDPDHALFVTGYGGYETFDLTALDRGQPTRWSVMSTGIEETVALELVSPPEGAHVLTAIGDYGAFAHADLDRPPPEGDFDPRLSNTTGLAVAALEADVVVRTGAPAFHGEAHTIAFSLDAGRSWSTPPAGATPAGRAGHVAVSADGGSWVWVPDGGGAWMTRDRGQTWTPVRGLTGDGPGGDVRVTADPVDPALFHAVDAERRVLLTSLDGGETFDRRPLVLAGDPPPDPDASGDDRDERNELHAVPGRRGDLWLPAFGGLYRAPPGADAFQRVPGVRDAHAFGFGMAPPGSEHPALYLVGEVAGVRGVYRSDDAGGSWVRINDDRHQWGIVLQITGDPKRYGRVYVGTHGRGVLYGDPVGGG